MDPFIQTNCGVLEAHWQILAGINDGDSAGFQVLCWMRRLLKCYKTKAAASADSPQLTCRRRPGSLWTPSLHARRRQAEALTCSLSDCVSTDRWTHSIVLLQSDGNTPAFTITRQTQRAALTPETRVCLFEFSDKVTEKRSDSVWKVQSDTSNCYFEHCAVRQVTHKLSCANEKCSWEEVRKLRKAEGCIREELLHTNKKLFLILQKGEKRL